MIDSTSRTDRTEADRTPADRLVTHPDDWRLLLPSGWVTISTDHARRDAVTKRQLDRQFRQTARDELIRVRGLPVSATLLVGVDAGR